ncbi:MAG: hypothetical protein MI866_08440, partial [Bacteroidales bacterium]|nr:hypothetical protein [Bacteroidales bacterium]
MKRVIFLLVLGLVSMSALAIDVVFDFDELASGKKNIYTLDVTSEENPDLEGLGLSKVELRLSAVISNGYSRFVNNDAGDGLLGINTGTTNRSWDAATYQAFVFEFDLFDSEGTEVAQDIIVGSITANVSNVDNGYKAYASSDGYRHSGGNNVKVYLKWLMNTGNDNGHANVAKSNVINPPATGIVDVELIKNNGDPFAISSDNTVWIRRQNTNGASNETNQLKAVTISIPDPRVALSPVPDHKLTEVSEETSLQWNAGDDPNNPGNRLPNVVEHNVYVAAYDLYTAPEEPNFATDATIYNVQDAGVDPLIIDPIMFGKAKKVFWRVDQVLDYDEPVDEFVTVEGDIWTFETEQEIPVYMEHPHSVLADAGTTVDFSVKFSSDSVPSVVWYREGQVDPVSDIDVDVTITETLVDEVYENVLSIDNVEAADEDYYFAVVTNGGGEATSNSAVLAVKRLAAHYTLDLANFDQENSVYLDEIDNAHPAEVQDGFVPAFVEDFAGVADSAVDIDPNAVGQIGQWNPSELSNQLTLSTWVKWDGGDLGTAGKSIVAKNDEWGASTQMWLLKVREVSEEGDLAGIRFYNANGLSVQVAPFMAVDTWVHVAATFDGNGGKIYIDGE